MFHIPNPATNKHGRNLSLRIRKLCLDWANWQLFVANEKNSYANLFIVFRRMRELRKLGFKLGKLE